MKKRIISIICILGMVFTMPGCASKQNNDNQEKEQVQELTANIIDDKYRTFYEVFVYSFYDSDADGIGDLKGLTQKLDYINDGDDATSEDLGCNGIWLMPIMPSTTYHKYDVIDYMNIDSQYGTMEDFEDFLRECKKRDIHVIMDLVLNHTSSKHPWFLSACEYLKGLGDEEPNVEDCPFFDYYNFSRQKKSGSYYKIEGTDWYYEAPFWSEMPDLNLLSENVRAEIAQITQFWLNKGVAGFRLDAAKEYVSDNTSFNVEILSYVNETVKKQDPEAYIVAEVWTDILTYSKYYESGIDSVFNFEFATQSGVISETLNEKFGNNAKTYGAKLASLEENFAKYSESYIDAPFYTNHDVGRSAGYYAGEGSEEKTKISQAMNLLMTGNVFLYYGEELGMKGAGKDENKRAPMYWTKDSKAQGMCVGPPYMETIKMKFDSLEEQKEDEASIYNYVKKVIQIRNAFPEIARGSVEYLEENSSEAICVIRKEYKGSQLVIVFNLSKDASELDAEQIMVNEKTMSELSPVATLYTGEGEMTQEEGKVQLPAYSVLVYR